jgi:hypothetical protein
MESICAAHEGLTENINYLRVDQAKLFDLNRETSKDIKNVIVAQAKAELRLDAQDTKLDEILREVRKIKRSGLLKKLAIVAGAILGSGGIATLIAAVKGGVK